MKKDQENLFSDIDDFFNERSDSNVLPVSTNSSNETNLKESSKANLEKFYSKLESMGYNLDELREILDCSENMLILSGAGSGKTTSLILKIIRDLISGDLITTREVNGQTICTPANILVSTFLKTGAEELKVSFNEWCKKLGLVGIDDRFITFKTIHAEVFAVLKAMGVPINIMEDGEAGTILRQVMQTFGIHSVMSTGKSITQDEVADISCIMSYVRNRLDDQKYNHPLMDEYTIDTMKFDLMLTTFRQHKAALGKVDFEDLQEILLEGLKCNPFVRDVVSKRYDFIYVDEFQDTSQLQYEILKYYFGSAKRVLAIGDDDQCLVEGTKVQTLQGEINIEDVKIGDKVLAATGHGKTNYGEVESLSKKKISDEIFVVKTKSGKEIKATGNHIGFSCVKPKENRYFVYLMYKKEVGYRVGISSGVKGKKNRSIQNGFMLRLNQENADASWLIHSCETLEEARYYEAYYSCKYGLPQQVFHIQKQSSYNPNFSNYTIEKLHTELDTIASGVRLLADLHMYDEYPHYVIQSGLNRNKIRLTMFGGSDFRQSDDLHYSELTTSSANEDYLSIVKKHLNYSKKRVLTDGRPYYNARLQTCDYDRQFRILKDIEKECKSKGIPLDIDVRAKISDTIYNFTPFSHMLVGMFIPTYDELTNTVIDDEIIEVSKEKYIGYVYDLNISKMRNFVANSVFLKNCIYSWRGSDIDIITKKFETDYSPVVKQLTTNYRCSQNILNAVIPSIEKNTKRHPKKLRAFKPGGLVNVVVDGNVNHLLDGIKSDLSKGGTVGVLARTNADLLIPTILLELDDTAIDFGISKSVGFNARIPKQVFGLIDLITKRYTPEFDGLLKLFTNRYKHYEVDKLCDILNINRDKSLFNIPLDDLRYSAPSLFPFLNEMRNNYVVSPVKAYVGLLEYMQNNVYDGKSIYAQRARDFVYYIKKIILEHDIVKTMTIDEIDNLFNVVLDNKIGRRKGNTNNRQFVKLTTVHEAKGKEWDSVYIWNDIVGCFPNSVGNRELTESEFEEERRVHYIAWTRPKNKLTVYTRSDREKGFLAECDLSGANVEEINGVTFVKQEVYNKDANQVYQKKPQQATEITFADKVKQYYAKYTSFEWVVKPEGIHLDICDTNLGGRGKLTDKLIELGVDLYPNDMIESSITAVLEEIAGTYLNKE